MMWHLRVILAPKKKNYPHLVIKMKRFINPNHPRISMARHYAAIPVRYDGRRGNIPLYEPDPFSDIYRKLQDVCQCASDDFRTFLEPLSEGLEGLVMMARGKKKWVPRGGANRPKDKKPRTSNRGERRKGEDCSNGDGAHRRTNTGGHKSRKW